MFNAQLLLACSPIPSPNGLAIALGLAIVFVFKPACYLAFIQAFRFRVSRPPAMSSNDAGIIAALRYVPGGVLIALLVMASGGLMGRGIVPVWFGLVALVAVRAAVWLFLGHFYARLRGGSLAGFAVGGTLVNLAFDVVVVYTFVASANLVVHGTFFTLLALFLFILHVTGGRGALVDRFSDALHCADCGYNLTGNTSGACPECGKMVLATRWKTCVR